MYQLIPIVFSLLSLMCLKSSVQAQAQKNEDQSVPAQLTSKNPTLALPNNELKKLPLGWSLSGLTGANLCVASGQAQCNETYPGVNLGLSTEYRWKYLGINLNLDWGNFTPTGTGSDQISNTFGHLGLGLRYYYTYKPSQHLYLGASLGMGEAEVLDQTSESSVQWSSFWSDLRVDLGALWRQTDHWSIESGLSMIFHTGGTRCIAFQGAGPCQAVSELEPSQRSIARVLMLRFGARWTL